MSKCGVCGKFLATTGGATCSMCNIKYHKACVNLGTDAKKGWKCLNCSKLPLQSYNDTHVRGVGCEEVNDSLSSNSSFMSTEKSQEEEQNWKIDKAMIVELVSEIRLFRTEMQSIRLELVKFREEMQGIKEELATRKTEINNITQVVGGLEKRLSSLESSKTPTEDLKSVISQLQNDINDKDQQIMSNDIEIAGVPENAGENLMHLASVVALKLGTSLEETEVVEVYRAGLRRLTGDGRPPPRSRPIVVRLSRRAVKDKLIKAARVRRSLNTSDMAFPGDTKKVYINDRLTKVNKLLFMKTKEEAKKHSWRYVWINNGKILTRQMEGHAAHRVYQDEDIDKIFLSGSV